MSEIKDLRNKSEIQSGNVSNNERPISFSEIFSNKIMPKIYGFGAAVAIMGAMFKLLSLPGGSFMLGAGLSTEAFIFFISAFEKPAKQYDWSIVFPQLDKDYAYKHGITDEHGVTNYNNIPAPFIGKGGMIKQQNQNISNDSLTDLLSKCNVDQESLNRLGSGIKNLSIVCSEIGNFSKTTVEWVSLSENLNKANVSFEKIAEFGSNINNSLAKIDSEFTKLAADGGIMSQVEMKTVSFNEGLSALSSKITDLNKSYDNVLRALKG